MPHMYILRCSDGSYYVGSTRNLERRLEQHAAGAVESYTRSRLPVTLVFAEEYDRIDRHTPARNRFRDGAGASVKRSSAGSSSGYRE